MSHGRTIRIFATADGVMERAARTLVDVFAARPQGPIAVALSGGSTPALLYAKLAGVYRSAIPWGRIDVFFGDERSVPPDHPASNYRLAREALLERVPIPPERIHRMPADDADPAAAARLHEAEIRRTVAEGPDGVPSFDLVWLGLGKDGHTASLFPGAGALNESARLVVPAEGPPPHSRRMTFTLPLLAAASRIQFLVLGVEKAEAVLRVFGPADAAQSTPAARVCTIRGQVEWLLDRAAASLIHDPGLIA